LEKDIKDSRKVGSKRGKGFMMQEKWVGQKRGKGLERD
jgi:hypothetical protein